ncbi:hypothetical protein BJ944DRAFT_244313 [Cunninghamella echinulata]|nr:hypothetical protein BJ944DRAFT_244313 [Cunninghamella echinulata]
MSRECRYICQRAANAIISEIGPYRVSTDALIGINQILDEFLVQLLTNCQSLDLSRIKTSVFTLLPSTLGKNAIVEAELEVKTFTETEVIDYDVYEKMRLLGEAPSTFPLKECLPLLRDKCFEYCTLADKDDQQSWYPHPEPDGISISPIVAIYVTTVLEHMAEYILTAVAVTAENEDTDYVRIKELFLALVDDVQIGLTFHNMDLCEKMEKRVFPHGYQRYRPSLTPTPTPTSNSGINKSQSFIKSSGSENGNFLDITFDDMDLNYEEDENTSQRFSGFAMHNSSSNPSFKQRPTSLMTNGSTHHSLRTAASSNSLSNKKAFKVFKNESSSISLVPDPILSSSPVYDPDTPTMNFEDLIRSGNTMRVSLTPNRLKSIETKDQMIEDPAPAKPAWQRRSSSVPRMSTSSTPTSSRPQTPTSFHHPLPHHKPSPLVKNTSNSITKSTSISTLDDSSINTSSVITNASFKSTKSKSYVTKIDNRFENPRDAPKPPVAHSSSFTSTLSTSSTSSSSGIKMAEKTLPTPTSSTSSRQSKNRSPIPTDMKSIDPPSPPKISNNKENITPSSSPKSAHETVKSDHTSKKSTSTTAGTTTTSTTTATATTTTTAAKVGSTISSRPTLRRSSVSSKKSRENLRRLKEQEEAATVTVDKSEKITSAKSSMDISRKNNNEITKNEKSSIKRVDSATSSLSSSSSLSLKKPQQQKVKKENGVKKSLESSSSESVNTLSSNEMAYTQEPESIQQNETENNNKQPERPSSIVAKRASGSSRRQSLHESYAMEIGKEFSKEKNDQPLPSSTTTTAGTVGSTIKQLDEVVKQKSTTSITTSKPPIDIKRSNISKNIQEIENKNENDQQQEVPSSLLATSKSPRSLSSSSLSLSSSSITSASSRRSLVLDKVLQFERAHSVDDVTQRRSSSYIPRRERFMYLQRDPNALVERSTTTNSATANSIVRPGTSASIAAAAARFAAGVSLGIQTDQQEEQEEKIMTPSTPTLVVTDESGNSKNASSTLSAKNKKTSSSSIMRINNDLDSDNDSGSEHGIVEGDEEWFLPDDEWEDIQEQENAVAEWLLGEA